MTTHASFFSGAGGMDIGLERAGWRTVSFSEIEPYACSILETRWPGVPNLGDIVSLAAREGGRINAGVGTHSIESAGIVGRVEPWHGAVLWSGGFPCQDLSVAGKRAGMVEGSRSNLAHAFLDIVERHRPPAILLENVPGLLSSHGGRDMATLIGRMVELGYGVAYRILDARHFGVPQRRRRVFILALRSDPDDADGHLASERAAAVLSVGARCSRHPATGQQEGPEPADRIGHSVTGSSGHRAGPDTDNYVANALGTVTGGPDDNDAQAHHLVATLRVGGRASGAGSSYDNTPWGLYGATADADRMRTTHELAGRTHDQPDPEGIDSPRYRCIGNGVVSNVAEWIGRQLIAALS